MKVIFVDKQTKQTTIFSCKTELSRLLKVTPQTLYNWSKDAIKETESFIICFDVKEVKNRKLMRNKTF